jgi:hypothetical protein
MWHALERRDKFTWFWWERDHSEERGVDGMLGSEWILGRLAGGWEVDLVSSRRCR